MSKLLKPDNLANQQETNSNDGSIKSTVSNIKNILLSAQASNQIQSLKTVPAQAQTEDELLEAVEALGYVIVDPQPEGQFDFITNKVLGDITGYSAAKQFAIGGVCGWAACFLSYNVGKIAALAFGGCLVLIQMAEFKGYTNLNFTKVKHVLTKDEAIAKIKTLQLGDPIVDQARTFYAENTFLAAGFASGILSIYLCESA